MSHNDMNRGPMLVLKAEKIIDKLHETRLKKFSPRPRGNSVFGKVLTNTSRANILVAFI